MAVVSSTYFVYILTTKNHRVFYTGMTNDIRRRTSEHKSFYYKNAFSAHYNVTKLVYFEEVEGLQEAFQREQQIKHYKKSWKINLINSINPTWKDFYEELQGDIDSATSAEIDT